jgi:hypothetical protein
MIDITGWFRRFSPCSGCAAVDAVGNSAPPRKPTRTPPPSIPDPTKPSTPSAQPAPLRLILFGSQ